MYHRNCHKGRAEENRSAPEAVGASAAGHLLRSLAVPWMQRWVQDLTLQAESCDQSSHHPAKRALEHSRTSRAVSWL